MFDHVSLFVADAAKSVGFYERVLTAMGYEKKMAFDKGAGFGTADGMRFVVAQSEVPTVHAHFAFVAPDRAAVDSFHAAALAAGGTDNGAPGIRPKISEHYYAAFILDPDGNNVEASCRKPG
jgi:catechol 2,3-dioxygenase-like lactoylglutathione lyase family enzyme